MNNQAKLKPLKTYIVHLQAHAYAEVEVEAESSDAAVPLAMARTAGINWAIGEPELDDTECLEVEEA